MEDKANDSNAMHNSKCPPNNDVRNHQGFTGEDSAAFHRLETAARSSILKNISPVERNVVKWTEELIGMYDCYKPDFNCFEYNF